MRNRMRAVVSRGRLLAAVSLVLVAGVQACHGQNLLGIDGSLLFSESREPSTEEDEIETDRDSFTPATTTPGRGRWVVESAYSFVDNRDVLETHSFPELLIRRGVGDWLELRFGANYEVGGAGSPVSGNVPGDFAESGELERESRVFYGFKAMLNEQRGLLPTSAVLIQGFTPTSGEATKTNLSASYIFGWENEAGLVWDSALRYATSNDQEDDFSVWSPSTVVKAPVGERWKVHAEYFGIFTEGRGDETGQHFFSPGAHYLITPQFEIGARVGWGLNDQSPNFFTNVGLGVRF